MRKALLILTLLLCGATMTMTYAQDYKYEQDYFDKEKTNIYDDNGNVTGYYEQDYFDKDKLNVYNSRGTKVGYYKRNYFNNNWEYFDY